MTIDPTSGLFAPARLASVDLDGIRYGRCQVVTDQGAPAPALRVERGGRFRIRLAVNAGARTIAAQALQPAAGATPPVLRVRRNPALGIAADVEASAPPGAGWKPVSVQFTASADGGVEIELENPDTANACWWDEIRVT